MDKINNLNQTVELMISEDYKERFISEYAQLALRTIRLSSMVAKYDMNELNFTPKTPIEVLKAQLNAMNDYLEILEKRAKIEEIELPEVVL